MLSPEDEQAVLAHLEPDDRALFVVAIDTLVRLGDVLDLKREHKRSDELVIEDSKTGCYTVPLSKQARAALDSLPGRGPYYFGHRRTAENPQNWPRAVRTMFARACKRAGVPYGRGAMRVTWHTTTRASGATRMLQRGVDPATVQQIGHWADLKVMSTYLQTNDARKRDAVERIAPDFSPASAEPRRKGAETSGKPQKDASAVAVDAEQEPSDV